MRQVGKFRIPRSQGRSLVPVLSVSRFPHEPGCFISNSQVSSFDRVVDKFQFYPSPGSLMRQVGSFPIPRSQGGPIVPVLSLSRLSHVTGWFTSNSQVPLIRHNASLVQFYPSTGSLMRQVDSFPIPGPMVAH
jgi:hypothetical protein